MIPRIGSKVAATAATALALSGIAAIAVQSPAHASTFSATYSCSIPIVGTESVTVDGALTASPNPATAGSAVSFDLSVASLSLTSPLTINSWSATANVAGTGAESSSFQATGSGGTVSAGSPITNANLTGSWTPTASGTDQFEIGSFTITANVVLLGNVTAPCTPTGTQPISETLTVS
jgi:hypothetical protein